MFTKHVYLMFIFKANLALNNLIWLICHQTQPNQRCYLQNVFTNHIYLMYMYKLDFALNNQ